MLSYLSCLAVIHVEFTLALCDEWGGAVCGDESTSSSAGYAFALYILEYIHYLLLLCVQLTANLVE